VELWTANGALMRYARPVDKTIEPFCPQPAHTAAPTRPQAPQAQPQGIDKPQKPKQSGFSPNLGEWSFYRNGYYKSKAKSDLTPEWNEWLITDVFMV